MSNLNSRILGEADFDAYDRLISQSGSLFAGRDWLNILPGQTTFLGLFDGSGTLQGACPIHHSLRMGLRVLIRQPFTPSTGPYFTDHLLRAKDGWASQRFFLSEICSHLRRERFALCSLSLDPGIQDALPFRWSGYKVIPSYTYRILLHQSENNIRSEFSSTRRRNIRAAERDSIRIVPLDSYEIIEKLASLTFSRQETKLPRTVLQRLLYQYASPENSFAFSAFDGDEPVAGTFCVHDSRNAYYLAGGYDEARAHHGAGAACMQASIFKAKSLGLQVFDFEGSVIPAIERYFRGFGGILTPYFTVNRAWFPIEVLLKFRKRELF